MRRTFAFVFLLTLVAFAAGCARRVTVEKPGQMQVVLNDRLVDVVSDKSMIDVIVKAPADKQADLIREWIATKERLAAQILNNEDKKRAGFWAGVLEVLKIIAPAGLGYLVAK
jgi:hypothetical protein